MRKEEQQDTGEYIAPDISQMTEQDAAKFLKRISKNERKITSKFLFNLGENNAYTETLEMYIEKYAPLFADNHDAESRNFIKWALNDGIQKLQSLHDKITQTEKKYNLPLEYED
jgi:ferritin